MALRRWHRFYGRCLKRIIMKEQEQQQTAATTGGGTDATPKTGVTHNLDTGRDEPLGQSDGDDEELMDFGSGSGGGSAGDGGAA